ncbi:RsiV family protein [Patescibacteria group bacterium]|nr:RsiV family protein [Patescibacteria group bacterium]
MGKNKKSFVVIIAALAIVVAGAAVYFFVPGGNRSAPAVSGLTITTATMGQNGQVNGENYTVSVYYPNVSGVPEAGAFNDYTLALISSQINDFKTAIAQNDISRLPPQMQALANTFNIRYSLDGTSTDYVSAVFGSETYLVGMAHPSHLLTSLDVDLRNGSVIKLSDLFAPGADYLKTLSDITTADILRQIRNGTYSSTPDFVAQTGGTSPNADNFQVFGLSPQGLVVHFQDYQVGPGVSGPAKVVIPYGELQNVARPGGLIAR